MLEKKKLQAELSRVIAAKHELDYLVAKQMEEVQRLKDAMAKQEAAELALLTKMKEMGDN